MHFEVRNHRLFIDGRPVPFVPSPHVGGRIEPTGVLYHYTADRLDPYDSVRWFQDSKSKVSAHFIVGRDGTIVQMVDLDRAAWHAGESSWQGRSGCNGFMHGIEVDNPGRLTVRGDKAYAWFGEAFPLDDCVRTDAGSRFGTGAWLPYTAAQLAAVEGITRALAAAYPGITSGAGHCDVSPGRKEDPGPLFPLDRMLRAIGGRYVPGRDLVAGLQDRLDALGYPVGDVDGIVGARTRAATRAFQEENGLDLSGVFDPATVDALSSPYAKEMPTAHREEITAEDLAAQGSETIAGAELTKRSTETAAAVEIADAIVQSQSAPPAVSIETLPAPGPALPDFETVVKTVEQQRGMGDRVLSLIDWLQTPRGLTTLLILGGLTLIWKLADNAEWRRVLRARLGLAKGRAVA